jgi:hypothetical protein
VHATGAPEATSTLPNLSRHRPSVQLVAEGLARDGRHWSNTGVPGAYASKMDSAVAFVARLLRERGFRRQRHVFNAEAEPGLTQVLTFQMGAHPPPGTSGVPGLRENLYGAFTINLGLHFDEVRDVPLRTPRPAFLREVDLPPARPRPKFLRDGDCHVTTRLGQLIGEDDVWWKLDLADDDLQALVQQLVGDYALPFFERFRSRRAVVDAWHARDPAVRYTPRVTIAVIHARLGEAAEAAELLDSELRETERPVTRQAILQAAAHLGLDIADN